VIVLDTHAWLWWTAEPRKLSRRMRQELAAADRLGVCTISCYEVAVLARRGRIDLDRSVAEWVGLALTDEGVETLPLTPAVAVAAASLDERFPGDSADRIIYATARAQQAQLATKDAAIRRFDRRTTIW
jgi:PIN domain nuclease of toxin-antitoxin system